MGRIRGNNLKPETAVRKAIADAGFPVCQAVFHSLPGSPDAVVLDRRVAVFVDGCFWHRCPRHFRLPKTRRAAWKAKIDGNVRRDNRVRRQLRRMGWAVYTVRECAISSGVARVLRALRAAQPKLLWFDGRGDIKKRGKKRGRA